MSGAISTRVRSVWAPLLYEAVKTPGSADCLLLGYLFLQRHVLPYIYGYIAADS